ncbi:MAG TPA: hypothetical protein PKE40_13180 [Arachnia sp.]|nr:hypothetical protein [Arachnia sp.]HMT87298.1 hypothetical protein [Arachnia sp.]
MIDWIKKIAIFLVAAFVLFFIFTRPEQAADVVRSIFDLFGSIATFFTSIVS